jgi:GDP-D-mannose dehydratase
MTREMISLKKEHVDYRIYNGLFFNHESVFRGEDFFTSKVINQAIDVKLGLRDKIEVNSLSGSVDMGLAADYCEAAMRLQDSSAPSGDYIFSSGELTSLRFFVETVLSILDIPNCPVTQKHGDGDHREPRVGIRGDSGKLQSTLGFKPRQHEEWIRLLIEDYWGVKSRDS